MFGIICVFIICFLSIYIVATLFIYSKNGDLNNSLQGLENLYKIGDKDEVIKQMYELIVFGKSQVRWPILIALSIVFAIFITYTTKSIDNELQRFLIIFPLVFLPLYISFNYMQAHGGNKMLLSAGQLFVINKNLDKIL